MKQYPDPQKFMEQYLEEAAERRAHGLARAGITQPSEKLLERLAERDLEECERLYIEAAERVCDHNVGYLLAQHQQRENEIKRSGRKWSLWMCPPIAAVLGLITWYNLAFLHDNVMGAIDAAGTLAFLVLLAASLIFNRPAR